jgi:hypothetical protein
MKEIDTEVQLAVHTDAGTFLDVLSINHNFLLSFIYTYFLHFCCFPGAKLQENSKMPKSFAQNQRFFW